MKPNKHLKIMFLFCIIFTALIIFLLIQMDDGRAKKEPPKNENVSIINIALIEDNLCSTTKMSLIEESLKAVCKDYKKTFTTYNVKDYKNSYEATIQDASKNGAALIICPDDSFEEIVHNLQTTYVNLYFMIVGGLPHNSDSSDTSITYNTIPLIFDDTEIGFLAGYCAVYEGYRDIAFIGKEDSYSSTHYYYGFLQGANAAAEDANVTEKINITCKYTTPKDSKKVSENAYSDGAEIIVTCEDDIIAGTVSAASASNKKFIACGDSYETESKYLLASFSKNLYSAVYDCTSKFFDAAITGGNIQMYGAKNDSLIANYNSENFIHFDSNIYNSIYVKLANDEIQLNGDTTVPIDELDLEKITVK